MRNIRVHGVWRADDAVRSRHENESLGPDEFGRLRDQDRTHEAEAGRRAGVGGGNVSGLSAWRGMVDEAVVLGVEKVHHAGEKNDGDGQGRDSFHPG